MKWTDHCCSKWVWTGNTWPNAWTGNTWPNAFDESVTETVRLRNTATGTWAATGAATGAGAEKETYQDWCYWLGTMWWIFLWWSGTDVIDWEKVIDFSVIEWDLCDLFEKSDRFFCDRLELMWLIGNIWSIFLWQTGTDVVWQAAKHPLLLAWTCIHSMSIFCVPIMISSHTSMPGLLVPDLAQRLLSTKEDTGLCVLSPQKLCICLNDLVQIIVVRSFFVPVVSCSSRFLFQSFPVPIVSYSSRFLFQSFLFQGIPDSVHVFLYLLRNASW